MKCDERDKVMNYCPKFTVIIPVYNVAAYLAKCIDSVLKQEFKQYEVILIDDGSTDESGTICDKFAEQDKRIVVIHQKNKGLSAARNIGIENAKGEYILFLDSDDYWHDSSALNIIYSRLNVSNADILSFNYMSFITNKKEYNRIMKRLNQNKDVLRWSKNRKVQMLQLVDYIGGNKLLVFLLRIKNRLNKLQ